MSLTLATRRAVCLEVFRWTAGRQAVAEAAYFRRDLIARKTGTDRDNRRVADAFCWAADWAEEMAEDLAALEDLGLKGAGLDAVRETARRVWDARLATCREFGLDASVAMETPLVIEMANPDETGAAFAGRN